MAKRTLASLDDPKSCTLGWLEYLTHQMVRDPMYAQAKELNVSPALAHLNFTKAIVFVFRRPVHNIIMAFRMPYVKIP